ncbi:hypothetical protein [Methanoregula sp.]|jgi:hypothetical protein|uniref:hypothetical protein n=1 Tax=Methanoregula sp. TaxID=2052170 RepID=UPI003C28D252
MPYGWIADEKFKVFTRSDSSNFQNDRYVAVWLDILVGEEAAFDKAKMDIMNYVSKRQDDLVFSCFVHSDFDQSKLSFQFYYLQPDFGWKKIMTQIYSSNSDFNQLSPFERGQIGEALGNIFTERLLYMDRSSFFPELKNENLLIEECILTRRCEKTLNSMNSWIPDAVFQVFSNPDPGELKYEFNPKKFVYVEVKTGKSAKFERWQKEEIIQYSKFPDSIVLFCEVIPDSITEAIKLNVKKLIDEEWKTIKTFKYSDFSDPNAGPPNQN